MAGLPHNVSAIIAGESTSFLRRAARFDLSSLPSYEVEEAVRITIESAGRTISQPALDAAVQAIGGFPFMLQLPSPQAANPAVRRRPSRALSAHGAAALVTHKRGGTAPAAPRGPKPPKPPDSCSFPSPKVPDFCSFPILQASRFLHSCR